MDSGLALVLAAGIAAVASVIGTIMGWLGRKETRSVGIKLHNDHEGVQGILLPLAEDVGAVKADLHEVKQQVEDNGRKVDQHLLDHKEWDGKERRRS